MAHDGVGGGEESLHQVGTLKTLRQHSHCLQILVKTVRDVECLIHSLANKLPVEIDILIWL